jgi:hypothetical protein
MPLPRDRRVCVCRYRLGRCESVISDKAMRGGPGEVEEDRQVDRWIGRWTDG